MQIKKFIWLVLIVQLAMLELVGLEVIGFNIPILRAVIGFIYLTFIPGLLILCILRLNKSCIIELLLYSVGLSIALVMFVGFFINMLYPVIGISKPLTVLPVITTISFVMLILCIIAYKLNCSERIGTSQNSITQQPKLGFLLWPAMLSFLLPILSILGIYLIYHYQSNFLILILLFFIALIVALVALDKFIPTKLYPILVITISISLLWHTSLISPSITGGDIVVEYYWQKQAIDNSYWDNTAFANVNSLLSIVMLGPIYTLVLNLDTAWVLKIIYPFFFSMVPLTLFQAYRKQMDEKIAFLGTFLFMATPVFFFEKPTLARQEVAELFLALSILLLFNKDMAPIKRRILLIIFAFSIVVAHYSISYMYILYLLGSFFLLLLWKRISDTRIMSQSSESPSNTSPQTIDNTQISNFIHKRSTQNTLNANYVILFIIFSFSWFIYNSLGSGFDSIVRIGDHIVHSISSDFLNKEAMDPHVLQALGLSQMRGKEIEWELARIFQYIIQFFIIVGFLGLIANLRRTKFHREYIAMIFVSIGLLVMSLIIPYLSRSLNMTRIYHLALFFIAPLSIMGGINVFSWLAEIYQAQNRNIVTTTHLKFVVLLILVPFFLFASGFIFEITGATSTSMPLSLYKSDWLFFTEPEISAKHWLGNAGPVDFNVYSDERSLLYMDFLSRALMRPINENEIYKEAYIFLRRWNIVHHEVVSDILVEGQRISKHVDIMDETIFSDAFRNRYKIYDSGGAQVFGPK